MTTHVAAPRSTEWGSRSVLSEHFPSHRCPQPALPATWRDQVLTCARTHSSWQKLDGSSVTSREEDFGEHDVSEVGVVSGDVVEAELPWLMALYRGPILELANGLGLGRFTTASDIRSSVNINSVPRGSRYEWHVDSNPLTALLFVTTHEPVEGGALVFRPDPRRDPGASWENVVHPVSGELLIFDARRAAHAVTRLEGAEVRVVVPMNYYLDGEAVERPADLDDYLYGQVEEKE
jgi:hypothetical protein